MKSYASENLPRKFLLLPKFSFLAASDDSGMLLIIIIKYYNKVKF